MCGIFGIIDKEGEEISNESMERMHKAQLHRGPDHFGYLSEGNVFLGNNRLSIIDINNGNQPFYSADRNIAVLQNGEIFNYKELQDQLIKEGVKFNTNSDTEVILRCYELYGISMLEKLNGMFAITIYDKSKSEIYLVRDRFGQKPIFYCIDGGAIYFSSEIKSILEAGFSTSVNPDAVVSFLRYNFVATKETIFKGIFNVEPGCYLKIDLKNNHCKEFKWWDLYKEISKKSSELGEENVIEQVRDTVFDAIRIRMRSDVEYSAFLSGGIDSSIIVSQMNKVTNERFNTFTIGFKNSKFDESEFANEIAKTLNVNHRCEFVENDVLDYWERVIYYTEQPHGDVSFIPMFLLSKFASEKDRVVLTGDGADEIFGGYEKYLSYQESSKGKIIEDSILFQEMEIASLINNYRSKSDSISNIMKSKSNKDYFEKYGIANTSMLIDTVFLLPYNNLIKPDRMGMAHSVELRSPFMDYRVVSLALAIRSDVKLKNQISKNLLREAFKSDIPELVYKRDKQKFIVPLNEHKNSVDFFYEKILTSNNLNFFGVNAEKFAKSLYIDHKSGSKNNYRKLRALAALSIWSNTFGKYIS